MGGTCPGLLLAVTVVGCPCLLCGLGEQGRPGRFGLAALWNSPFAAVFTPPVKDGQDPFDAGDLPEDLGYHVQMKDGIVYVYADKAAAERNEPKDLPYPGLENFIDDMNFLLVLIAQGPV